MKECFLQVFLPLYKLLPFTTLFLNKFLHEKIKIFSIITKNMFVCSNCGNESLKWKGQCEFCKEWNTLKEFKEVKLPKGEKKGEVRKLTELSENQG